MTAVAFPKPVKREKAPRRPMQRSAPIQRAAPIRRTRMKRRLKTKQQIREAVFAPYVRWLHAPGASCVVCGYAITEQIQAAHVGTGGTGMKHGTAADAIRLCSARPDVRGCHADHDSPGGRGFFAGWTRERKQAWDRDQRLTHWAAFGAWAGIEILRLSRIDDDDSRAQFAALVDCDAVIAECAKRLSGGAR